MASRELSKKTIYTGRDYAALIDAPAEISVDAPAQFVSRITLSGPTAGNRMGHVMRAQLLAQLMLNDQDPDVRVTIVRGAGESFCAGQDVQRSRGALPFFTDESDGQTSRNTLQGWFTIMDLAKPVIAQVHGDCLGSGMELAAACDIVYAAADCRIGYPAGRNMGLPDMQIYPWLMGMRNALSVMLQAETMDGECAVARGFATRSFPAEELEARTIDVAKRVATIPSDLLAYNKRSVHRAFEAQGMRANLRHGVDLEALMFHSTSGSLLTRAAMQGGARAGPGSQAQVATRPAAAAAAAVASAAAAAPAGAVAAKARAPAAAPKATQAAPKPAAGRPAAKPTPAAAKGVAAAASPAPARSSHITANPTKTEVKVTTTGEKSQEVAASAALQSKLASAGVHLHLHKTVTIHLQSGEEDELKSKL
jgi:enoyl-CoA hydratase